jgi:hypothetical protein
MILVVCREVRIEEELIKEEKEIGPEELLNV